MRITSSNVATELLDHLQNLISQPAVRRTAPLVSTLGFTIVELLIVIVVIGILAAIVIAAYNGITKMANESAVTNDLSTIAKELEQYKTLASVGGTYPSSAAQLDQVGMKLAQGSYMANRNNVYYCVSPDGLHYSVGVIASSNKQYYLTDGNYTTASGVNYGNTCHQFDPTDTLTDIGLAGYAWNTTTNTGAWATWTQ